MNILFIASRLHPNYTDSLSSLAKVHKLKVIVATQAQNERHEGIDITHFKDGWLSQSLTPLWKYMGLSPLQIAYRKRHPSLVWLVKFIRKHNIDTVYARRDNKHLLRTAWISARFTGCKFITYRQEILDSTKPMDRHAIYPLCKNIDEGILPENYIPLNIDLSRIPKNQPIPAYEPGGIEPLRIIAVGKLIERKGHQLLIEAAAQLRERIPLQINIYGAYSSFHAAQYGKQIAEMILDYNLQGCVKIMPSLTPDEMLKEYARHHVFVYSGWVSRERDEDDETYSRANGVSGTQLYSLIEAMASGLPVVCASERKVVGAVKNGSNGLVFEKGSASDLAEKIEAITKMDLTKMGSVSRGLVIKNYNSKDIIKNQLFSHLNQYIN